MDSKPTFILVPGAWHSADTWTKVMTLLTAKGYQSTSITLPTTTGNVEASLTDDVRAVQEAINTETSQKRNVILVVHSYGGAVGQSAMQGFTKASVPSPISGIGHVIGLVNISTGFALPNMTFLDGSGGQPPPIWRLDPSGFAELQVPARDLFYHDLPEAEGDELVSKLTKQSNRAFNEGADVAYAGWKDVPVWHLLTTEDKALPLQVQKMLVAMVGKETDLVVKEIASSHSPMLSRPDEVVQFILDATSAFTKT